MSKLGKFAAAWAAVVLSVSAFGEDPIALTAAFEGSEDPACVYLKADAAGTGTGRSWANACTNVAEAIDAAAMRRRFPGLSAFPTPSDRSVPARAVRSVRSNAVLG